MRRCVGHASYLCLVCDESAENKTAMTLGKRAIALGKRALAIGKRAVAIGKRAMAVAGSGGGVEWRMPVGSIAIDGRWRGR